MSQNTLILCFPRLFLYQDKSQFSRKNYHQEKLTIVSLFKTTVLGLVRWTSLLRQLEDMNEFVKKFFFRTCPVDHKIVRIIKNQHSPPFQTTISGPAQWTSLAKLRVSRQWKGLANISSQSGVQKATVEVPEYNVIRQTDISSLSHGCKEEGECILFVILSLCFILEMSFCR